MLRIRPSSASVLNTHRVAFNEEEKGAEAPCLGIGAPSPSSARSEFLCVPKFIHNNLGVLKKVSGHSFKYLKLCMKRPKAKET